MGLWTLFMMNPSNGSPGDLIVDSERLKLFDSIRPVLVVRARAAGKMPPCIRIPARLAGCINASMCNILLEKPREREPPMNSSLPSSSLAVG